MIGNDIVDLHWAKHHSRWKEERFMEKLFVPQERDFISSEDRFENIWRLWSMKESAYKIMSRVEGTVKFNPKSYVCSVDSPSQGYVHYNQTLIATFTTWNQNYVASTAYVQAPLISEVFKVSEADFTCQRTETYQRAVHCFAALKALPTHAVQILKNAAGVPMLYCEGILQKQQLSLSHHGNYGAFAISV